MLNVAKLLGFHLQVFSSCPQILSKLNASDYLFQPVSPRLFTLVGLLPQEIHKYTQHLS